MQYRRFSDFVIEIRTLCCFVRCYYFKGKNMGKSCAFTGHRPAKFAFGYDESDKRCIELKRKLRDTVTSLCFEGYTTFYVGMAEGVDIWAAECLIDLLEFFRKIELCAVIPFRDQKTGMNSDYKARYERILKYASQTFVISEKLTKGCFKARNYFMVEQSDALVAVYDEINSRSGTGQTVRHAEGLSKRIILIKP